MLVRKLRNITYMTQVQFSPHLKKALPASGSLSPSNDAGPSVLVMTHVHPSPHLQITYLHHLCQSSLQLSQPCSKRSYQYRCIILWLNFDNKQNISFLQYGWSFLLHLIIINLVLSIDHDHHQNLARNHVPFLRRSFI